MGLQKVCIGLLLGMMVLAACGKEDSDSDLNYNQEEIYFWDIVSANVSKYPELNTTDIAIEECGSGPMI